MFLCTCIKVVVTTLLKFSRQNSETFLMDFWKWGKNNKPSRKYLCNIFVWTCTTNFWRACRNHACKSTKDLFRSKSENDSNAKFSKRSIFSFTSLLQKIKKTSSGHAECGCDHRAQKFLSKIWKFFCSNSGIDEKVVRFPSKVVSPKNVRLTWTRSFG